MTMHRSKLHRSKLNDERRNFLKTVGLAGISSGLLRATPLATSMMLSRTAMAQGNAGINKAVFVYIPGGCPIENGQSLFTPSGQTGNLTMKGASAALDSVKNEMVFFSDASITGGAGHGFTQKVLGGSVNADTIDVALSNTMGANSPFPLLLLGAQSNAGPHGYASQRNRQELTYQDNPIATFERIFSGSSSGGSSAGTLRARSVLDTQKAEIAALKAKLGVDEQQRLDTHLDAIESIERRLDAAAMPPSGGGGGSSPADGFNPTNFVYDPSDNSTFTKVADLQMDLAVLALQTNQSRVVSVMLGNHQSEHSVPELSWNDVYHQSIHGAGQLGKAPHTETRNHLSARFAHLIEQLRSTNDDLGNPLLDSTIVVQVTDMGDGDAHGNEQAPMILAGGGAAVNKGQVTTCGAHANILDTATELLGYTGMVPQYGSGPLTSVIA